MKTENEIREMLSDDDNIIHMVEKRPETYNSLLACCKDNKTLQQILRRRIKRLFKDSDIWKLRVPGTRFGLCIFCSPSPDYIIITSRTLTGVRIFYMYDYKEEDKYLILNERWELDKSWTYWKKYDDELKIPKYSLKEGGFRIWE